MGIDFGAWLADGAAISETARAALAWRRIKDRPSSVAFKPPSGSVLDAQTVRVEHLSGAGEPTSAAGAGAVRRCIIFGVRNHATVDDTDIAAGYRFVSGADEYRVIDVITTPGEVQALAEAVS